MKGTLSGLKNDEESLDIIKTDDGSFTIFHPIIGEHYHSTHGALQESRHVFLNAGLQFYLARAPQTTVSILEVGFGTGLNFLVTADYCRMEGIQLLYTGIERHPLSGSLIRSMHYQDLVNPSLATNFYSIYEKAFNGEVEVIPNSSLSLAIKDVCSFQSAKSFDVLYFDAFAAAHQPEMWTVETISHVCHSLKPGGVFVTYAITGNLKRTLKSLGFQVEKAAGAPGKREMLRAVKC